MCRHMTGAHLVVVVSGPGCVGLGLERLVADLQGRCTVLHSDCCRHVGWMYDGIDAAGRRLCQDIVSLLHVSGLAGNAPTRISFAAHGVGGLIARYAAGLLADTPNALAQGTSLHAFASIDSPHLGLFTIGDGWSYNFLKGAAIPGRTGAQLRHRDSDRLIMSVLAGPALPYLNTLHSFKKRLCVTTTDPSWVPYTSSSLQTKETVPDSAFTPLPFGFLFDTGGALPFASLSVPPLDLARTGRHGAPSEHSPKTPHPIDHQLQEEVAVVSASAVTKSVADTYIAGITNEAILREAGTVSGRDLTIEHIENAELAVLDRSRCTTVCNMRGSVLYLGPVAQSLRIIDTHNSVVWVPAMQISLRGCSNVVLRCYTCLPPLLEMCGGVKIMPYTLAFIGLAGLWCDSGLPPGRENAAKEANDLSRFDVTLKEPHVVTEMDLPKDGVGRAVVHSFVGNFDEVDLLSELPKGIVADDAVLQMVLPFPASLPPPEQNHPEPFTPLPANSPSQVVITPSSQRGLNSISVTPLSPPQFRRVAPPHGMDAPLEVASPRRAARQEAEQHPATALRIGGVGATVLSPLRHRASRRLYEGTQTHSSAAGCVGQYIAKVHPACNGSSLGVSNCEACSVVVADWTRSTFIEDVKESSLMLGVCADTTVLVGLQNCVVFVCSPRVRLRGCHNVTLHVWTTQPIIAESCTDLLVTPWTLSIPRLDDLFERAGLSAKMPNVWFHVQTVSNSTFTLRNPIPTAITELGIEGHPAPCLPQALANTIQHLVHFAEIEDPTLRKDMNKTYHTLAPLDWMRIDVTSLDEATKEVLQFVSGEE